MSKHALNNAARCRLQARLQRLIALDLARKGDHLGAFTASLRSHRLAQAADAWQAVV